MDGLVEELTEGARAEMAVVEEHGGAVEAVPYMKTQLVESHRSRVAAIEAGDLQVIGQNVYTSTEDSPLAGGEDGGIMTVDPGVENSAIEAVRAWRSQRDQAAADAALAALAEAARDDSVNIMPASIEAARAGVTTGEWAQALRDAFGEYRAPTGVADASAAVGNEALAELREKVERVSESLGRRIKILVGKPGLDGHSNGAEQIAVRARDVGMEVIYQGIRLTPEQIAASARDEDVDVVGLSILSGSHRELVPETVRLLREEGVDAPVVVGGIIPPADANALRDAGVARVYTPKDFDLNRIMGEIADLLAERAAAAPAPAA
jgi:(2R)-ethylmalonyl-CoA mutase